MRVLIDINNLTLALPADKFEALLEILDGAECVKHVYTGSKYVPTGIDTFSVYSNMQVKVMRDDVFETLKLVSAVTIEE